MLLSGDCCAKSDAQKFVQFLRGKNHYIYKFCKQQEFTWLITLSINKCISLWNNKTIIFLRTILSLFYEITLLFHFSNYRSIELFHFLGKGDISLRKEYIDTSCKIVWFLLSLNVFNLQTSWHFVFTFKNGHPFSSILLVHKLLQLLKGFLGKAD